MGWLSLFTQVDHTSVMAKPAVAALVVALLLMGCNVNHAPEILDLAAERETVLISNTCVIECVASDPGRDELSFEWYATEGQIGGFGPQAVWHAPSSPGIYQVLVMVQDEQGKEAREHLSITVKTNLKPRITSLSARNDWVRPRGETEITCSAEDPDGDTLYYLWSADADHVSGSGPTVRWTAPADVRLCEITVTVQDEDGAEDQRYLVVSVASRPPPQIREVRVMAQEPRYLKDVEDGFRILKGRSCRLTCVLAAQGGQVQYKWVADDGQISGEGPSIIWTAPDERGTYIVRVVVSDENDNTVTRSVAFQVETCSCAID